MSYPPRTTLRKMCSWRNVAQLLNFYVHINILKMFCFKCACRVGIANYKLEKIA